MRDPAVDADDLEQEAYLHMLTASWEPSDVDDRSRAINLARAVCRRVWSTSGTISVPDNVSIALRWRADDPRLNRQLRQRCRAARIVRQYGGRRAHRRRIVATFGGSRRDPNPAKYASIRENLADVKQRIKELPDFQRKTLEMRAGLTSDRSHTLREIAEHFSVSISVVYSALTKAIDTLSQGRSLRRKV